MAISEFPSTMEEQIEELTSEELNYRTIHNYVKIDDLVNEESLLVPHVSLINKYRHFLTPYVSEMELEGNTYQSIKYSPKLLSYILYGTTELWSCLLLLNNCKSVIDFDLKTVKIYNPDNIKDMINEILILEGVYT
nr:MAG TPA: hypothetical protein [Caudoviricetes sp.]